MANYLGIDHQDVKNINDDLKKGVYGDIYKDILLNRDAFCSNRFAYQKIMDVFTTHDDGNLKYEDTQMIIGFYMGIVDSYHAGYSVESIAKEYNMTPLQIQNIADLDVKPIIKSEIANYVYKMYGSNTLDDISIEVGASNETVKNIITHIKKGSFGDVYKRLLFKRDFLNINQHNYEYVVN